MHLSILKIIRQTSSIVLFCILSLSLSLSLSRERERETHTHTHVSSVGWKGWHLAVLEYCEIDWNMRVLEHC